MTAQEETAAADYEAYVKDDEIATTKKQQDVKYKNQEAAGLDKDLADHTSDREGLQTELDAVMSYGEKVRSMCTAKPETYEERKARREAEIADEGSLKGKIRRSLGLQRKQELEFEFESTESANRLPAVFQLVLDQDYDEKMEKRCREELQVALPLEVILECRYSASKMVAAYTVLALVETKKLNLDTKVNEVLSWWTKDTKDKRSQVTVKHLLSQTDGFPTFKVFGVCLGSEEGCAKCRAYFYPDRATAEKDAGKWVTTSRIMLDIANRSEMKELRRWGPRMPHNTIRTAASMYQEAIIAGPCGICLQDAVVTTRMQCCERDDSGNRICAPCLIDCRNAHNSCPFCRAPL